MACCCAITMVVVLSSEAASGQCAGDVVFRNFTCVCIGGYTVAITKCDGSSSQNCQPLGGVLQLLKARCSRSCSLPQNCQPLGGVLQPCGNNCYAFQDSACGGGGGISKLKEFKIPADSTVWPGSEKKVACSGNDEFMHWLSIKLQTRLSRLSKLEARKADPKR
jgi:hypothetical protein